MLPPGLEAFVRLPFWNAIFLMLAIGIAVYSGWSMQRRREKHDVYYLLLGLYLTATQLPIVFPFPSRGLDGGQSFAGSFVGFLLAIPAVALFILAVRAR